MQKPIGEIMAELKKTDRRRKENLFGKRSFNKFLFTSGKPSERIGKYYIIKQFASGDHR